MEGITKLTETLTQTNFAQVNVDENPYLAQSWRITSIPAVLLFKEGSVTECTEKTAAGLAKWVNRHETPALTRLRSITEADEFIAKQSVVVLGFFLNVHSKAVSMLGGVANSFQKCAFGHACERKLLMKYSVTDGAILLLKKNVAPVYFDGNLVGTELLNFLRSETSNTLIEANSNSLGYIISTPIQYKLFIFVFEPLREIIDAAAHVSNFYKQSVIFATVDVRNPQVSSLLNFFGINKNYKGEIPTMRIITHCQSYKFKSDGNTITVTSIKYFVDSVIQGRRQFYLKCEPLPLDWNKGPVWALNCTLFQQIALDPKKCVLVKFYAPWCGPCVAMAPHFKEAAMRYRNRPNVHFCEVNCMANELREISITSFPTVVLFGLNNTRYMFFGDRSPKSFCDFIDTHC